LGNELVHGEHGWSCFGGENGFSLTIVITFFCAKNRAFVDGNKRVAFLAMGLFLYLNGWRLHATQAEATLTMLGVAAGSLVEPGLANWLRSHAQPRT